MALILVLIFKISPGVNICPKKSEIVYPEIWGILKLSVLIRAVEVPKKKAGKKAPVTGAAGAF